MAKGLVFAAPRSGSGKTVLTLAIARALSDRGIALAPSKTGPDYIDPHFLALAAQSKAINLDPWAMPSNYLQALVSGHTAGKDLLVIEGVMGLFDGALSGGGSTADLAAILGLPIVLIVDCRKQAQSVAALVHGFVHWREDVEIAGVILNRVASTKHVAMLRGALEKSGLSVVGAIPDDLALGLPERHLGLTLPGEIEGIESFLANAARLAADHIDLDALQLIAHPVPHETGVAHVLPPLGQHIAIARDRAFAFAYPHLLDGWHSAGATLSFFSPLSDEAPHEDADAVFLPGGYPELHAEKIANAHNFAAGLKSAQARGALIYGECGGFMVLGRSLTTRDGVFHAMTGLLPIATHIDKPRRVLGYRFLRHNSPLPWPETLRGHEFHYSSASMGDDDTPLFAAADAVGTALGSMGLRVGNVMGSYAHVICARDQDQ